MCVYIYIHMESILTNAEYLLVDSSSFKLPGGVQYLVDPRSVTFHTEGSNRYSASSGTRVVKFRLNGEGWLDPSTVRMIFNDVNDDNAERILKPIGHCHGFVRRLRISVRGQIIADIQDYIRVHHMFNILQGPQVRLNEGCEGFGTPGTLPGIGGSTSVAAYQTVMFKPSRHEVYTPSSLSD